MANPPVMSGNGLPIEPVAIVDGAGAIAGTAANPLVISNGPTVAGATSITASSGNVANGSAVATLAGVAAKTTYIAGFQVTAGGATAGADVTVTVAGVITGTMSYTFTFPTGAVVPAQPLIVSFYPPIPASAVNTAVVVTVPAGGTGNTNTTVSAQGFQV